jgi:hypothetical protein
MDEMGRVSRVRSFDSVTAACVQDEGINEHKGVQDIKATA